MSKTKKAIAKPVVKKGHWYVKYQLQFIIAVFTFFLFSNSLFNNYNLDDELVTRNHRTTSKGISAIPEIFSSPYYQDDMGYAYEYRPVVHTTFAIEHTFFGESPFVGHLINLLLYIALCLILFKLLIQIGLSVPLALFVTLLFSAHTTHTEVVCSIKNRDEILGLLFSLWSMLLAIKSTESKQWIGVVFSLLLFLLAMLSKGGYILFAILIPLSVVLFSTASFGVLMGTTVLMSLVGYFFLDIPNASTKNFYLIFVNLAVVVFYWWARRVDLIKWIRDVFSEMKIKHHSIQVPLVERESLMPYLISSILVIAILAIKFFLIQAVYPSVFLVILVLLTATVGSYFKSKIWNLEIGVLTAVAILYLYLLDFEINPFRLMGITYGIIFTYITFFTSLLKRGRFYAYYSLAFALILFSLIAIPSFFPIYVFFLLLCSTQLFKNNSWAFYILFLITIVSSIYVLVQNNFTDYNPTMLLELGFVTIFFFRKYINQYIVNYGQLFFGLLLALVLIIIFFNQGLPNLPPSTNVIQNDLGNAVEALKSTKTDRPLSYIEYPLPPGTSIDVRLGTAFEVMGFYAQKLVWPYPLAFYYGYEFIKPLPLSSSTALLGLVLLIALSLTAIFVIRKQRQVAFGLITLLASLAISSGFFMPVPGVIGDRYMFVASMGWSVLLGYFLFYLLHRFFKIVEIKRIIDLPMSAKAILITPLLLYSLITFSRNFDWKDHLTLMRKDIAYVSNSAQAHNLLALNIMKYTTQDNFPKNEYDAYSKEAITHFKKSFEIYPNTFNVIFDIGRVYIQRREADSALHYFLLASKVDSSYNQLFMNIGELFFAKGQLKEAVPFYQKYIELTPNDYDGYGKLSYIYFQLKDYENSIAINIQAAEKLPNLPDPFINIGQLYLANKQNSDARFWLLKADSITNGTNQNIKEMLLKTAN